MLRGVSWISGPNGEYALVGFDQWHEMADAIDAGDLDRARDLLQALRPWTWPTRGEYAEAGT